MKVVVFGATGNVGWALGRALADEPEVDEVVGVARRLPEPDVIPGVQWQQADIASDDLTPLVRGADAVVHLAWLIQPNRSLARLRRVNVDGTARLLAAVAEVGVPTLVYASSVGAYSPGPGDRRVDETWPTHGVATSSYSRQKAYVERMLDSFGSEHPESRVVRLRPALIFQAASASEQRRFFAGALFPSGLLRRLPLFPHLPDVRFQAVHTEDVADAYRRALLSDVSGAFNVAAEPVLRLSDVADVLGARTVSVPAALARVGADVAWRLRLHPVAPGWVDLARRSPIMDTSRIRDELGWEPRTGAREAVREVLEAIVAGKGAPTPTLAPDAETRSVAGELLRTGQGARYAGDGPARTDADRRGSV